MKSIRDLYKVGKGPSSSHTMGPERAARIFKQENPGAERYEVTLYGSLALTGVGHGTDRVLSEVLAPTPTEIIFSKKDPGDLRHPNTLDFAAYKGEEKFASMRVESIGGGDIVIEGREAAEPDDVYPENSFAEIAQYCRWRYISLREYVELNEGPEIWDFLQTIWRTMRAEVEEGLEATGILPGGLNVQRKARYLYERQHAQEIPQVRELQLVCAYAFAAAEQNAANGTIVTAPTCGSCGGSPVPAAWRSPARPVPAAGSGTHRLPRQCGSARPILLRSPRPAQLPVLRPARPFPGCQPAGRSGYRSPSAARQGPSRPAPWRPPRCAS